MSSSLLVGLVLWFGCGVLAAGMNHAYMLAEFGPDKHARKWAAFAILIGAAGLVFSLVMSRGHGWRWPWGDNGHTGISTTDTEGDTASGATYYASTAITTTAYADGAMQPTANVSFYRNSDGNAAILDRGVGE